MSYISLHFAAMTMVLFFLYYTLPKRFQPYILLVGSLYFYYRCSGTLLFVMMATSAIAYICSNLFSHLYSHRCCKYFFATTIVLLTAPLFVLKYADLSIGIPVGISFYTLQLIAYCVDVYQHKTEPETNFFHFLLFTSFFPQILQGPIPRYSELKETMFSVHTYNKEDSTLGFSKILTGLLLKFMIADKAAVLVDTVFNANEAMPGYAFAIAGILYSFQLYADFISCVSLAQGVSLLFGIHLGENFMQPYCAVSIKDFWHRWHISLSSWLRDYIYIPLGGSRKGKLRTDINLILTFLISGIWHGVGFKFAIWGIIHGLYQIIGKYTINTRNRFFATIHCPDSLRRISQHLFTFLLVTIAWIIFRANSLADGIFALYSIVFRFSSVQSVSDEISSEASLIYGLSIAEFILLVICIVTLLIYDYHKEKTHTAIILLNHKNVLCQCFIAFIVLLFIAIFGTYGFGYDSSTFIYGGF